jgi:hypothetical protein
MDIVLHPFESEALVKEPDVGSPVVLQVRARKESEGATLELQVSSEDR